VRFWHLIIGKGAGVFFARGEVTTKDHKTIDLCGWHRVYMNQEHSVRHALQIAFLD
jgi:hypothetical protein